MNAVINFRTSEEKRALIDRAVAALGTNRTAFILTTLVERAEEVLADRTNFALSADQVRRFNRLLDEPINAAAIRMLTKPAPWA
ncbi:DUF1778 domain-containing protein [Arenimonas daejeonensis]|uniref:type II toxin-antitoxin system TacA family antitoxin n=1 Tax=Arenimonas daejeonensis TaxID=370777 RepID=UPI0011BDA296|nr:DUF1778 domain-containing protein [Arenimonas daejeonensis]